jgi:NAD(P)-dependent dehydrogenase (short-subunit alcohol dehydrogenase family)
VSGQADRTAVVVGASGAIGSAVVGRLLDDGWQIVAVARNVDRLHRTGVEVCAVDVTTDDAVAVVRGALGDRRVRLLVHAASAPLGGHVLEAEAAVVRAAVEVKVVALLRLVQGLRNRFAVPGRIVALGGNLGFDPIAQGSTAGIANAAQANLVRMLNRSLAPDGITAHTIAPGPVDTPRFRALAGHQAQDRGLTIDEIVAEAAAAAPTGALTTPEQVAWAVALLTAPQAEALAGGTLLLDGGRRTALP